LKSTGGLSAIGGHSLEAIPFSASVQQYIRANPFRSAGKPFNRQEAGMNLNLQVAKLTAFAAFAALSQALFSSTGAAQTARIEVHPIKTMTLSDQQFLNGVKDGPEVIIGGELLLPRLGSERLPAVVLLHGAGGISAYVTDWIPVLNSLGVATFLVDSFTGRGLTSVLNDQAQLGRLVQVFDSFRALELIAKHPRIQASRIAAMGFSRGGQGALYASVKRFQKMHSTGGLAFAAHIPFYPTCNTTFIDDENVTDAPIRIFHGSADDFVPVAPCRSYVERLRKVGKNVELTEYPGARHVFDGMQFKTPLKLPDAHNTRNCRLEEIADGIIVNSQTKQRFTYSDPCVERGAAVAYQEEAHKASLQAVKEILGANLKLN
jgi:dienelactone hydrolase